MNEQYGLSPNKIEKKSLSNERFRTLFNFHRIEWTKKLHNRQDRYDKIKYGAKRKKLQENLNIGEKVLVLAKRIQKKSAPGKIYKQSLQNITYFNKKQTYVIRTKQKIDKIIYYWLKNSKKIPKKWIICFKKQLYHVNLNLFMWK